MRRKDREITGSATIERIMASCEVLRLGLYDPEEPAFPYIVPVNFGYAFEGGTLRLYLHGARAGRKFDLLQRAGCCSFEMDVNGGITIIDSRRDITTRYQSVMGKADVRLLEGEEALHGLDVLLSRREDTRSYPWNKASLPRTAVWELTVTALTAKQNQPEAPTA